ncbi:ribonuclease III [Arenicella xantha]|uniref:Ribonuclease 3 n=1 Tax=Arenicella xantha TaxID=644221 RepID=A0A395JK45_9GAMM|nr:ribonuclease III [Arenicella xantha]RBP49272.1 RNAse III [Arenicella xantha]
MKQNQLSALMRKLDYEFNDTKLLILALTHRSKGSNNYERLEFLGDSILGFVVAEFLFKKFPKLAEGKLSRMRSSLVRKETLALVARELDLSSFLILGEGELKSGGFNRDSILADTVESLIGAIYLDSNFDAASRFIYTRFRTYLDAVSEESTFKDAKSRLQEAMQKQGLPLPNYDIVEAVGEQHNQRFTVECSLPDSPISSQATARSRRQAEQKAAAEVLQLVKQVNVNGG